MPRTEMQSTQSHSAYRSAFQWVRGTNAIYYVETAAFAIYTQSMPWTLVGGAVGFSIGLLEGSWEGKNSLRDSCVEQAKKISQGNVQSNSWMYAKVGGGFLVVNNLARYAVAQLLPTYVPMAIGLYDGLRTGRMAGQEIGFQWMLTSFSEKEQALISPETQKSASHLLEKAINMGDLTLVEALLTSQQQVNMHHFCTALLMGNIAVIQLFFDLHKVQDINAQVQDPIYDGEGLLYTPLQYVGTPEAAQLLLDKGALPSQQCGEKARHRTALHVVAARPCTPAFTKILEALLSVQDALSAIDQPDDQGATALFLAIQNQSTPFVKVLLHHQAQVRQEDWEEAQRVGNAEILRLLEEGKG